MRNRCAALLLCVGMFIPLTAAGEAVDGRMHITAAEISESVSLTGDWYFSWGVFEDPSQPRLNEAAVFVPVPSTWRSIKEAPASGAKYGIATYRLTISLPESSGQKPGEELALYVPPLDSAYRLYFNGIFLGDNGDVSEDKATNQVFEYSPFIFPVLPVDGDNEVLIHMANFEFPRGGFEASMQLGSLDYLTNRSRGQTALDLMLAGILIAMAIYHLSVFLFRRNDRAPLYFAILCTIIALRILITGDGFLYRISDISWALGTRLEYLTWYLSLTSLLLYTYSVYTSLTSKQLIFGLLAASGILSIIAMVGFTELITSMIYIADGITAIVVVYCLVTVIRVAQGGDRTAYYTLSGALVFAAAVVNDVLFALNIINTRFLVQAGLTMFAVSQAILLARRYSLAFVEIERLGGKLAELNEQLEEKVHERTSRLERAYAEIRHLSERDALTGCYNRGYLESGLLDELLKAFRYKRSIAIVMCDLDNFKRLNDDYGHQFGDETLKRFVDLANSIVRDRIDWIGRYGGEEFVVVLPETDVTGAYVLAERLRAALEASEFHAGAETATVTASFGIAAMTPDTTPNESRVAAFLHASDKQLYRAKQAGKNRVEYRGRAH